MACTLGGRLGETLIHVLGNYSPHGDCIYFVPSVYAGRGAPYEKSRHIPRRDRQ